MGPPSLQDAACRGLETDAFYAEYGPPVMAAKLICGTCQVRVVCRAWGIRHEEFGIWGGLTPRERARIRRLERIALA